MPVARGRAAAVTKTDGAAQRKPPKSEGASARTKVQTAGLQINVSEVMQSPEALKDEANRRMLDAIFKSQQKVAHRAQQAEQGKLTLEKKVGQALRFQSPNMTSKRVAEETFNQTTLKTLCTLFKKDGDLQDRLNNLDKKQKELEHQRDKWEQRHEEVTLLVNQMEENTLNSAERQRQLFEEAQETEKEVQERLQDFHATYVHGHDKLATALRSWKAEEFRLQKEIYYMENELFGRSVPPGPYSFRWVASERFQMVVLVVIQANMLCNFLTFTRPEVELDSLNFLFLVFYSFELVSNVIYFQSTFFQGTNAQIWAHILDVVIVVAGVVELVVESLGQAAPTAVFRFIMIFRLLRFWKFVQLARQLSFSFVVEESFQAGMLCVICTNCVTMAFEDTHHPIWVYVQNLFGVFFFLEVSARIMYHGKAFFRGPAELQDLLWNYFDLLIVAVQCFTLWVVPTVLKFAALLGIGGGVFASEFDKILAVGRTARLLRVLRLVELARSIKPLYVLVLGIKKSMAVFVLVMVLATGIFFFAALLAVKLVGDRWIMPGELSPEVEWVVQQHFTHVDDAFLSFFKAVIGDTTDLKPFLDAYDFGKYAVIAVVLVLKFGIFPILVGSCNNNLSDVVDEQQMLEKQAQEEKKKEEVSQGCVRLFEQLDTDGSGSVDIHEFHALIRDESPAIHELCRLNNLEPADMEELFVLLSQRHGKERIESITLDEFTNLLASEAEKVNLGSVIHAEKAVDDMEMSLTKWGLEDTRSSSRQRGQGGRRKSVLDVMERLAIQRQES